MAVAKSGAVEAEQVQDVVIGIDRSDVVVLQLNTDKGLRMVWDADDFRKLGDEVVEGLRPDNMKNYLRAEALWSSREHIRNAHKVEVIENPFAPLGNEYEYKEYVRPRKGWKQAWKNPGRDLDAALVSVYQVVKKKGKESEKAGEETGETLKRLDSEGKVEAVAVECRMEHYQQYLEWMAQKSRGRFEGIKNDFGASVEDLNRNMGKNEGRITPLDGEGKPLV